MTNKYHSVTSKASVQGTGSPRITDSATAFWYRVAFGQRDEDRQGGLRQFLWGKKFLIILVRVQNWKSSPGENSKVTWVYYWTEQLWTCPFLCLICNILKSANTNDYSKLPLNTVHQREEKLRNGQFRMSIHLKGNQVSNF